MKRLRILNNRGDTIVEVLIVLAVLGLALAMSYATATRGLTQSRNAQEHSQALGVLTSQVELVRKAVQNETNVFITGQPFCMSASATPVTGFTAGAGAADAGTDVLTGYPAACKNGSFYNQSITYDAVSGTFTFRTHWDGDGVLGRQQELMTYRIRALGATADQGVPLSSSPARIVVTIDAVKQTNPAVAPTCAGTTVGPPAGESSIKLQQTNGGLGAQNKTTTNSVAIFDSANGVVEGGTYKAHINSVPVGFTACSVESGQVVAAGGTDTPIHMKIIPVCTFHPFQPEVFHYISVLNTPYVPAWDEAVWGTVYWWTHPGVDARHDWWPITFDTWEGSEYVEYRYDSRFPHHSTGYFFERWVLASGGAIVGWIHHPAIAATYTSVKVVDSAAVPAYYTCPS